MKKIIVAAFAFLIVVSCKNESKSLENDTKEIAKFTPEVEENAVIYEVNIRQYSPEGTFNAFTKDIPQLKEFGVKIIWVMPIFPISETKRKATGGDDSKFASEMPAAEQHKYLGSYYAVSDFKKVNPEFGTIEDFRNLVKFISSGFFRAGLNSRETFPIESTKPACSKKALVHSLKF